MMNAGLASKLCIIPRISYEHLDSQWRSHHFSCSNLLWKISAAAANLGRSRRGTYLPPETAADVATEFVSVTETVPMTLVSPLNVIGIVSENAPPLATPVALPNHVVASWPN